MPVEGMVPVTVSDWSTSSFVADGVGADGAPSCDETVIVLDAAESAVSARAAESVTWSFKVYVFPAASVLPAIEQVTVLPGIWPEPLLTEHCVEVE